MNKLKRIVFLLCTVFFLSSCAVPLGETERKQENLREEQNEEQGISLEEIPEYSGEPYVVLNNNQPEFTEEDMTKGAYEFYSDLDSKGKCGVVQANIGVELMPAEERGNIGQIKPSGWHLVKYDNIDGKYLYNRCHLIGFQLTGENANEKNLITGTRYMNVEGMLPFENMVADYIEETGNHVLYRVTPIFEGENLVASGVQMEAKSVEDNGAGICFHVYVYNVQPGIEIDYATGESMLSGEEVKEEMEKGSVTYILNTNTQKFHEETCESVSDMKEKNKQVYSGTREELMTWGYEPCGRCEP